MAQLTDNIWAVEVPEDAQDLDIRHGRLVWVTGDSVDYETLPPGSWQFLFTTKEATEEDARKIVGDGDYADRVGGRYYKISESRMAIFKTHDPLIALTALLKAKDCDTNKNYAIIQNTTNE